MRMMLVHPLLTIGLSVIAVHCHNYAMVCLSSKGVTDACQRSFGYYCNARGDMAYPSRNRLCSDLCKCIDLMPKPHCIARTGSGSMSCLRDEELIDLSTLFKDLDGYQDEAMIDSLRDIRLEERQVLGGGYASLERNEDVTNQSELDCRSGLDSVNDLGGRDNVDASCLDTTDQVQIEKRPHAKASYSTSQETAESKADNSTRSPPNHDKEDHRQPSPSNVTSTASITQAISTATTTSDPGQDTNCTDSQRYIKQGGTVAEPDYYRLPRVL